jgi:hypothetical protein
VAVLVLGGWSGRECSLREGVALGWLGDWDWRFLYFVLFRVRKGIPFGYIHMYPGLDFCFSFWLLLLFFCRHRRCSRRRCCCYIKLNQIKLCLSIFIFFFFLLQQLPTPRLHYDDRYIKISIYVYIYIKQKIPRSSFFRRLKDKTKNCDS